MEKIGTKVGAEIENMSAEMKKKKKNIKMLESKNRQPMYEALEICEQVRKRAKD